ncbi:hypothetical protein AMECASPLE_009754 [Ameca splendens]|uniref:Uncharacterized protein n=1 Tax=Ameca splendens TaxID=208324 RepID=A0ABV0ZLV9_9TELE
MSVISWRPIRRRQASTLTPECFASSWLPRPSSKEISGRLLTVYGFWILALLPAGCRIRRLLHSSRRTLSTLLRTSQNYLAPTLQCCSQPLQDHNLSPWLT